MQLKDLEQLKMSDEKEIKKMARFFLCETCKNLVEIVQDHKVPLHCCGKQMAELLPNTANASSEKHLPVVKIDGDIVEVTVGSAEHPMEEVHSIQWIYVETENGGIRKDLKPSEAPKAVFNLAGAKAVAVYEYCNLHGLWKTEV